MALTDSVTVLPGVGPKRQEALASLGIETVGDVLFYFPFRYDDLQVKDLPKRLIRRSSPSRASLWRRRWSRGLARTETGSTCGCKSTTAW